MIDRDTRSSSRILRCCSGSVLPSRTREAHSGDYVLTIDADGRRRVERFRDGDALRRRLMHEEKRLEADCWVGLS